MKGVYNYMETLVEEELASLIALFDGCKCERCKRDIFAIAMNELPPRYVVTENGGLYVKSNALKQQFNVDITAALTKAIKKVEAEVRHEKE